MAVTQLRAVQVGKEVVWGTPVAATAKLMAVTDASFQLNQTLDQPSFLGTLAPGQEVALVTSDWSGNVTVAATYEDLPYFFDGLLGIATPSGSGPYTYDYAGPTTAVPTAPRMFTVEYGAIGAEYNLAGGLITGLNINIEQGQAWRVSADFAGKVMTPSALTALSERDTTLINTVDTALTIDPYAGTVGSTVITATLIGATVGLSSERHHKRFVGGITPDAWGEGQFSSTLTLTCEFNATSKAYVDAMLTAASSKIVQLEATSGTNVATIDFTGYYDGGVTLFDDRDGNITVTFNLVGQYDLTNTSWFDVSIDNSVASLA
ncbi:MAG: hypothetical protein GY748_23240 [Planctomycetaceae bacterium]|nr:hypothetical protein [Planctomycetaceae bacterium]